MKTIRTYGTAARRLAVLAWLATLAPVAQAQNDPIAAMDVDGRNAFVDDSKQPASRKGIRILDGSLVRTGEKTSAKIDIIPEGFVQLGENSAQLVTASFFKSTKCLAVRLITGKLFINGKNVCFVTNSAAVSGISHSRIGIQVDERGTVLTVIEGAAELEGKPASMWVSTNEQLVVQPNGEYYKQTLDPAAAERTIDWTKKYFNDASGMSTAAKVGVGVVVTYGLCRLFGGCDGGDGDHDHPSPPPPPAPDYPMPESSEPQAETPASPPDRAQPIPTSQLPSSAVLQTLPVDLTKPCCIPYPDNSYGEFWEKTTPADCKARGGRLLTDTNDTCTHPVN